MVAYLCTEKIKDIEKIKGFNWDGYKYMPKLSVINKYVFPRHNRRYFFIREYRLKSWFNFNRSRLDKVIYG